MSTQAKNQLADARDKYHLLMTGQAVRVLVDQNGERTEFTAASGPKLAEYIKQLEIAAGEVALSTRRPLGVVFGA